MQEGKQGSDKFFVFAQYPVLRNVLDWFAGTTKRINSEGALVDIPVDLALTKNTIDKANFKHLKHHMGILSLETRLLKHYNIMNEVQEGGQIKNKRNLERFSEVKELDNILMLFIMLLYTKYSCYSGPYEVNNELTCTGADPTYINDDKIFDDMQPVIRAVEELFRKMLNYKYDIKDSENILNYGLDQERLVEKATFKEANINKGTKSKKVSRKVRRD